MARHPDHPRATKAYEQHAWVLLFVSSALLFIYALLFLFFLLARPAPIGGRTWDEIVGFSPELAIRVQLLTTYAGAAELGLGIFGMALSRYSYRKEQRWAWYALWYLPAFLVLGMLVDASAKEAAYSFFAPAILSLLGLVLPYRRFFPREGSQVALAPASTRTLALGLR